METSPAENLAVLIFASLDDSTTNDARRTALVNGTAAGQHGLLSISEEGSAALEIFIFDKQSLSGKGLEKNVEADPSVVLFNG